MSHNAIGLLKANGEIEEYGNTGGGGGGGEMNYSAVIITTESESYIGKTVTLEMINGFAIFQGTLESQSNDTGKAVLYTPYVGKYKAYVDNDTDIKIEIKTLGQVVESKLNPYFLYGFSCDGDITDPNTKVTYVEGCQNYGFTPVHMNFENNIIDGGDWFDVDVVNGVAKLSNVPFFFPRSCMLTYGCQVSYYLDECDESKTSDGQVSDYNQTSYGGNCMMEWGQNDRIIYMKSVPNSSGKGGTYYYSDKQLDSGFKDYAFRDKNGQQVQHFYTAKYFGSGSASKMRSISGAANFVSGTAQNEIDGARANGSDTWDTTTVAQWELINGLLILMAKSTDTQTAYGKGRCSSSSALAPGSMDKKGMFWGSNDGSSGVKVFGMENWWGNLWRRIRGYINASGTIKIKMTRGTFDGSTASDYNTDGTGYITISNCTPSGTNGGYISEMKFTEYGMFAKVASGTETTQYTDGMYFSNGQTDYAIVGGDWDGSGHVGALCVALSNAPSIASAAFGSALSCTPLKTA